MTRILPVEDDDMGEESRLSAEEVRELRHELRTPLNLIIGYSEMLLEDATGPAAAARRERLEQMLAAGRAVLALVNTHLSPTLHEVGRRELGALNESMREPHLRILRAADEALADTPAGEPHVASDLRRIREAADRLLVVARAEAPRHRPHPSPTPNVATGGERDAPPVGAAARARILVVDDLEDNRTVLERRLTRQGHEVTCATGGHDALERTSRERFDLVLLDVMMPDLDGLAVLERLKATPATRDVPVIMISALDDVTTVVRCIERGAVDHLPKPFDPVLLRARIDACLEKKRLRDAEMEYLAQVNVVIDAATAVESGTYTSAPLAEVARRTDELGRLARVFDGMAARVRAREDRLREQIGALRLEIEAANHAARRPSAERAQHELPTGEFFAERYQILEEIGSGGMGIVYRARDHELGEQVAIKTLRRELVADPSAIQRFKTEIRLARHISHRNVVRIHDIGESAGVYYLTMEHVEGITVRSLLEMRRHLGVDATLALAAQLADSLAVAHEQGIIHRDIKPENLLLDRDGVLKVMDFGVARLAEGVSNITGVGSVVGTPAYMAPEQLLSEHADARSDLYSAGVVLYECLTGKRPFDAPTPFVLIARILRDEPRPITELNAAVPRGLNDVIMRLLAKEPDRRPDGAAEVKTLLASVAAGPW